VTTFAFLLYLLACFQPFVTRTSEFDLIREAGQSHRALSGRVHELRESLIDAYPPGKVVDLQGLCMGESFERLSQGAYSQDRGSLYRSRA
jgi:hypothetical protein